MTPTPKGWFDGKRQMELQAIATIVGSNAAYKASPEVVSWEPTFPGDCTELTAFAESVLTGMGWPADAMERWVCKMRTGQKHAVLILHIGLDDGSAVETAIDCMNRTPMRKEDLGYTDWVKIK